METKANLSITTFASEQLDYKIGYLQICTSVLSLQQGKVRECSQLGLNSFDPQSTGITGSPQSIVCASVGKVGDENAGSS